jgi:hypothetical protein
MLKNYCFKLLLTLIAFLTGALSLYAQLKTDTLKSGSGNWKPPVGCNTYFVELWGGGAGGNTGSGDGVLSTGGGGGGSYAKSRLIGVDPFAFNNGVAYAVGVGGGTGSNGGDTWFSSNTTYVAPGGNVRGTSQRKSPVNSFIFTSYFGGGGGSSWRNIFNQIWHGGGGASGRRSGDGNSGGNADFNFTGGGAEGGAYNDGNTSIGRGGQNGAHFPGVPGGGGAGNQSGANGIIIISYNCDYSPGVIGNAHTVPFPPELPLGTDFITSTSLPLSIFGYTLAWEDSSASTNGQWRTIPGANQPTYAIPALQQDTWFRRVITNGCNPDPAKNRSNAVLIKVFSQGNGRMNGVISGRVTSKNGTTGVQGITITVQKTISLKGSPQSFKYTDTTDQDGNYAVAPIFYGDNSFEGGDPNSVSFTIVAAKAGHKLSTRNPVTLSNILPSSTGNNFIDSTVYSITGRVTQPICASCEPGSRGPFGVGNVKISTNELNIPDVYTDSVRADSLGFFAITVADPKNYTFTPSYLSRSFSPASRTLNITADTINVNFSDTVTKVISGKLTDIAGRRIGSGKLKFEGVYLRKDSTPITTFQKLADIIDSTYTVQLPAGKYKVTVFAFTPAYGITDHRYVSEADVKDFFNTRAIGPLIDITSKDSIRDLVYHRPPVVVQIGLRDTACNTNPIKNPGIVFRSNARKPFQVFVFEGPASLGDRVQVSPRGNKADTLADYVRFYTNITAKKAEQNADTIFFRLKNETMQPMLDTFFLPGVPNSVPDANGSYTKPFEMHYIDRYGRRAAPFNPKTTVVGILNPTKTFTTAAPEIPYLILHAPPGDNSYSYWEKGTSYQIAISHSVLKEDGRDGFLNISLAPTISTGTSIAGGEIGYDIQAIADLNYTHEFSVNSDSTDELVETITAKERFETAKNPIVTGNSGDVYIGHATNYILGKSIYVDFIENKPFGACEIDTSSRLIMAPKGFKTKFAYAEDHIVNVIIPQQQRLRDEATDDSSRAVAQSQIDVWNQVIEKNKESKKIAEFKENRSFSFGAKVDNQLTSTRSSSKSITYNTVLGNNIAFELGLKIAGIGASGGAVITMRETTTNDTITTNENEVTMGYHLDDDDPGDYYSVDIKEDPVYGTPVFDLVAGANSCPPEEGAQKRDLPQIISGGGTFNNWDPNIENFFTINLANKSESAEPRKYNLSVDATSSQDLQITVNGNINLVGTQVAYQLAYGQNLPVQIGVRRVNPNDQRFSFPNVIFALTDNCGFDNLFDPNTQSLAKYSFNYASACGSITLASPADGWVINGNNGNILPITMSGYRLNNVDSITLEYSTNKVINKVWKNGFTVKAAAISDPNSFTFPWNTSLLTDSIYALRLRMVCQNGNILYSEEATGAVDRKSPSLVGSPQPVSRLYNPDVDEISFTYDEYIDKNSLNQGVAELVRRSNSTIVPVFVTANDGKLVVTPQSSLGTNIDSFRLIVRNITDLYGNVRTKPDTLFFWLDFTPRFVYTGTNVAKVYVTPASMAENNPGKLALHFKLKEKATKITKVFFDLAGSTATSNTDYTISYDTIGRWVCVDSLCTSTITLPVLNQFSGSPGFVNIDSGKTEAIIYIDPSEDFENEPTENIIVTLTNGADYKLQDSVQAIAAILNSGSFCPSGGILYVNRNATGNNTGVSWQHAMTSLKNALSSTCPGITQIWVARGIYKPTTNFNRDSAFVMRNNLAIYGGFAGTETALSQRNIRNNPTILNGDIGIANNNSDNSYNVVRNISNGLNSTAILDGFTITGGNANKGDYLGTRGGGVNNYFSTPSFFNCIITGNTATAYGGGMFNQGATPQVVNSVFAGNVALFGGGLYNESASTQVINCSFSGNLATAEGGAISSFGSNPQITNSVLWGNSSAIRNNASAPIVSYSIVQGGYAGTGNLNTDPLFVFQPAPGLSSAADLRLQGCSPAINLGSNAGLPAGIATDLAGSPRITNTTVDMGAYERQTPATSSIIYVDATAIGNNSGENWANAYSNLSSALTELNVCAPGTTIRIAAGTYTAPLNTTFNFDKLNAVIQGGYPNGGSTTPNPAIYGTFLKGNVQVLKSVRIDGIRVQKQ